LAARPAKIEIDVFDLGTYALNSLQKFVLADLEVFGPERQVVRLVDINAGRVPGRHVLIRIARHYMPLLRALNVSGIAVANAAPLAPASLLEWRP
jgi:hypothetical protein